MYESYQIGSNRIDVLVFILNMQINMQVCNSSGSITIIIIIIIIIIDTVILPPG
jgi:hypothetical protein